MRSLSTPLQQQLQEMFGPRVAFDQVERMLYSHDVGSLPSLVKPLIGSTQPAGVVQPTSEEQIVQLASLSRTHRIPLVPRGKSSSGYGGVMPVQGGLVVDLGWMNQVVAIDAEALTVTVQPGVIWERLEKTLNDQGLALRTYPSSAPSSTVAGWLAQGGVGFGAYQWGAFRENVVSCRVVLPSGEIREFKDDPAADPDQHLDLISDAEGITGIITEVTLRVRPFDEEVLWGAQFDTAAQLAQALKAVRQAGLPLWSVSFINPTMADIRNNLPPHMEHGHVVEEHRPVLPQAYIAVFVASQSQQRAIDDQLPALVQAAGGTLADPEIVDHEWENRFNLMHGKRLGPSTAPSEVVVPLANLGEALQSLEARIKLPMLIEGMVTCHPY
ncbi:MAG: FAD-binding oxidoreductase, partial [Anaerolineae bacterium]